MREFRNWSGVHASRPAAWAAPRDEATLVDVLARAARAGQRVKAVGAGHSWSDAAVPEELALDLGGLHGVVAMDTDKQQVKVRGGTRLEEITEALDTEGLAMPILGSVAKQTIAGAIATATHGSSLVHGNLSSLVLAMRLVTPQGEVVVLSPGDPRLAGARVHLGALGVVSEVTLQVTRAFRLAEKRETLPFAAVVADLEDVARSAEYVKLWWLPSTGRVVVFRYERTEDPPDDERTARWIDENIVNRHVFDAVLRLAGRVPQATSAINGAIAASYLGPGLRVARSDHAFNLAMPPVHREAEWAFDLPRASLALDALSTLVRRERLRINFPCEIRFVRADDAWMSPAYGRDTCQIGVYQAESPDRAAWFEGAARIARTLGGRPHWGKESDWGVADLEPVLPRLGDFRRLARELDPRGAMANAFVRRVLGSEAPRED